MKHCRAGILTPHIARYLLATELLRDPDQPHRYITIDRWVSSQDYEWFLLQWKTEYAIIDAQGEGLAEHEARLGKWETI